MMHSQERLPIDTILHIRNRTFRTMPGKLLLGSTGKRMGVDYLDPVPGFQGRIDYIHKTNIPLVFTVTPLNDFFQHALISSDWYPSHLHLDMEDNGLELHEDKFVTWEDMLVSCQRWVNKTDESVVLHMQLPDTAKRDDTGWFFHTPTTNHGIQIAFQMGASITWSENQTLVLEPNSEIAFVVAACTWIYDMESSQDCVAKFHEYLHKSPNHCLTEQIQSYDAWFDDVPVFTCDDPYLEKTWWYRWFLLRHQYAEPSYGLMQHGVFYEGRSHKVDKTPYAPKGHEFTQLIPLSTPMHLVDCRWKRDTYACKQAMLSLLDSMDETRYFKTLKIDQYGTIYGNYAQWAIYQWMLVHPSIGHLLYILPSLKVNFLAVMDGQRKGKNILPVCYDHRRTGKEYQPSFWYFTEYVDKPNDNTTYLPLKRVDLAVYMYQNARGLEALCKMVDDPDTTYYGQIAKDLQDLILSKMWDDADGFFYDLHFRTEEKARVKNVTGVDPLWADITGERELQVLDCLTDENEFACGETFASVTRQCPVFSAVGGWKGNFFKGRNGCVWNGPAWPFTTAIALDALAMQSKKHGHQYDQLFERFLREYTLEHYAGHDIQKPYLVEHYDAITGEALSDEMDYLHSYYLDLIVRHVAGIEVESAGIRVHRVDIGLKHFQLSNVWIAGHEVCAEYDQKKGYCVRVDGTDHRVPDAQDTWIAFETNE